MSSSLRTTLLFVLICWIWSSTWLAIKLGLNGVPPAIGAGLRMSASGVVLLLVALARREPLPRQRIYPLHVLVQGFFLFSLQYALIYWAELTVPSGLAAVLFAANPIVTAILAALIFKIEPLSRINALGLLLGFLGVAVIYWSEVVKAAQVPPLGVIAMLCASSAAAFATTFAKRYARGISPLATVGPGQLLGGIFLGVLALLTERGETVHFNAVSAGALAYLTIFGTSITFLAYFTLMRTMPVTRLNLATYVTPVLAVALGVLVGHEKLEPTTFLGAAIVFFGIALVHQRPNARALHTHGERTNLESK